MTPHGGIDDSGHMPFSDDWGQKKRNNETKRNETKTLFSLRDYLTYQRDLPKTMASVIQVEGHKRIWEGLSCDLWVQDAGGTERSMKVGFGDKIDHQGLF